MDIGDRVIVPSYQSWTEEGTPYMVTEEKHLTGVIANMIDTRTGPGDTTMPGNDAMCFVVLDEPLGIQDIIVCKESRLVKIE